MDENINEFYAQVNEFFDCKGADPKSYSANTLAYIGDGFYELVIRSLVIKNKNRKAGDLHKKTSSLVKAEAQAKILDAVIDELTEEEKDVYHRGRNAKSPTMSKNASVHDYRIATGFEALMGYLYISGRTKRAFEIIKIGLLKLNLLVVNGESKDE